MKVYKISFSNILASNNYFCGLGDSNYFRIGRDEFGVRCRETRPSFPRNSCLKWNNNWGIAGTVYNGNII